MSNGITRQTFEEATTELKLLMLFDEIQDLKRQRWKKTAGQILSSFLGGFLGMFGLGKIIN